MLALKNACTDNELAKAHYVGQGHCYVGKAYMVNNITNLRQSSTRIIISVAAIKAFRIFSPDGTQACRQSEEKLTGRVLLLPK